MIKADHNIYYKWFFDLYTKWIIKSDFKEFVIVGEKIDLSGNPLLVISNHFSWWDGFFHYHLNNLIFKKKFHVMMLEEQLEQRMFLTKLGIFGVKKGSRDIVNSLKFAGSLLKTQGNMLLIFPQGKIESQHQHEFIFEKGADVLINQNPQITVLMTATFIDYFSERKPVAWIYYKPFVASGTLPLQEAYRIFFSNCLTKQKGRAF